MRIWTVLYGNGRICCCCFMWSQVPIKLKGCWIIPSLRVEGSAWKLHADLTTYKQCTEIKHDSNMQTKFRCVRWFCVATLSSYTLGCCCTLLYWYLKIRKWFSNIHIRVVWLGKEEQAHDTHPSVVLIKMRPLISKFLFQVTALKPCDINITI